MDRADGDLDRAARASMMEGKSPHPSGPPPGLPSLADPERLAPEIAASIERTMAEAEQAFHRKIQEAPRSMVDVTRMEVCTGMAWLADGSRISFRFAVPPVVGRVDGVLDQNGSPIYEIAWQTQVIVKPPKSK